VLHDRDGEVAAVERELDILDWEVNALRRMRHDELKARLDALGFDTSRYRPPPRVHESERRSVHHFDDERDDIEDVITKAKRAGSLDELYDEWRAGRVTGRSPGRQTLMRPASHDGERHARPALAGDVLVRPNSGALLGTR
jgi:hypothetical protein